MNTKTHDYHAKRAMVWSVAYISALDVVCMVIHYASIWNNFWITYSVPRACSKLCMSTRLFRMDSVDSSGEKDWLHKYLRGDPE